MKKEGILVPPHKIIKTPEQIEGIREGWKIKYSSIRLGSRLYKKKE